MDLRADRPGVFAGAIEPVGSEEGRVLGCAPAVRRSSCRWSRDTLGFICEQA